MVQWCIRLRSTRFSSDVVGAGGGIEWWKGGRWTRCEEAEESGGEGGGAGRSRGSVCPIELNGEFEIVCECAAGEGWNCDADGEA